METQQQEIYVGNCLRRPLTGAVNGAEVVFEGESFYRISRYDRLPPFFMSLVSSSDHWMFISSTGGLSAGRANAESALFPYYTDDRLTENSDNTGPVVILRVTRGERTYLWEPFSARYGGLYDVERNLYKNTCGDKLVFEEINRDLELTYRYAWQTGDSYGLILSARLINLSAEAGAVELVAGVQNLLPYGASPTMQNTFSNLLNAYKRSEVEPLTGLGLFTLSSTLSDLAEPSESLKATTVWQAGLENPAYLLSSDQLDAFRGGQAVSPETDVRGRRGAYLLNAAFDLPGLGQKEWYLAAEVNQDHRAVIRLMNRLRQGHAALIADLKVDIARGSANLRAIIAAADGWQVSGEPLTTAHHAANVMFNVMRGGIFADNYQIGKADLLDFVGVRNRAVLRARADFWDALPDTLNYGDLLTQAAATGSADVRRLCFEYLPLTFSRRHGDPSRPWNRFSINVKKPDGSRTLDYQGNWRDIFQNWESLCWSYPEFVEGIIGKFLNATTADGYNPYRVTRNGVEWEVPEPENPWANIGYWNDHQIIYLLKLLEFSARFHPGQLEALLGEAIFSHANVPYRLKEYRALLADPYHTINFDWELENQINTRAQQLGADGKLVCTAAGQVFHVNLAEKMLVLLLAKLVNFVPEGGIWLNTQRPEWNDANNALVGKGLSVVTVGYLRRYIGFFRALLSRSASATVMVTAEVSRLAEAIHAVLRAHQAGLDESFSDGLRRAVMDGLGQAGSDYRENYYRHGFSGDFVPVERAALEDFLALAQRYVEHTLRANRRADDLYHAYNILRVSDGRAGVGYLYEMLEGQVAILSSGLLSAEESLALLHSLRHSKLYRADQHSYILYPDRPLAGFLSKNIVHAEQVTGSALAARLAEQDDRTLLVKDENGDFHFNGDFRNASNVQRALAELSRRDGYAELVAQDGPMILALFEAVFDHSAFTGRSGTFFAYEGLGSIYWHMVSKLLLAVQETWIEAVNQAEPPATIRQLAEIYFDVRQGLGFNKTPAVYGAFPIDPYSHSPAGQGAKQPGMTGQVKEEILTRWVELGLTVAQGQLSFKPVLLPAREFMAQEFEFAFIDVAGQAQTISAPAGSLAFTFCQTPVVYRRDGAAKIEISLADGQTLTAPGRSLGAELSRHIFRRDGFVRQLTVFVGQEADFPGAD